MIGGGLGGGAWSPCQGPVRFLKNLIEPAVIADLELVQNIVAKISRNSAGRFLEKKP